MNNQESSHEISVNEEDLEFLEETKIPGTKQTPDHSPIAYINSTITITPRILFEHAHQQWFGSFLKYSDCISDFIDNLNNEPNIHRYLVLDNCHDIFNEYNKLTLKSLLSLSALVNNSITVVCISNLTWELMTDYPNPPTVLLQALADDDAIDLLSSECPEGETPEFYKSFVKLVYMSFSHATRDLNEQRYLIKKLWPKYMEPVYSNEVKRSQTTKLFAHLQPFVKASLRSLFLHTDTTSLYINRYHRTTKND